MRFIGNKENLVEKIYQELLKLNIVGESFFDFFSGTSNVSKYFKKLNYTIISSDLMYFSYVLQQAYIVNNKIPTFKKLIPYIKNYSSQSLFNNNLEIVLEYLNNIDPVNGFISKNYSVKGTSNLPIPRMFFSDENAELIDAIRIKIEEWYSEKRINKNEYFILLACLIETVPFYSNISGVYAAFQKKWDPRAIKRLKLRSIKLLSNDKPNRSFNLDSISLIKNVESDIYYLDPPYNQRQYAPNYHILETIAKYDNPIIKGVSGMRDYIGQKSKFCNAKTGIQELDKIAKIGKFKYLIMSYNSEGIMGKELIISTLANYGKVDFVEFPYLRFKSNNNGESNTKKFINEQLYILTK
jgi:adenine-specific DNA-methyltransferase